MTRTQELRQQIRELKAQMKASGIRRMCSMNRMPSIEAARANERLERLQLELEDAAKAQTAVRFTLQRAPSRQTTRERFENVKTVQRPLFIGANDEPGQTYLIDPFAR